MLVEHAIAHIEEAAVHDLPEEQQRWYAIKIFERDEKVLAKMNIEKVSSWTTLKPTSRLQRRSWMMMPRSIITNERYVYIASIIKACYKKTECRKAFHL